MSNPENREWLLDVYEVSSLDPEYARGFSMPWMTIAPDGATAEFSTEEEACAHQRSEGYALDSSDKDLTAEQLDDKYNPDGDGEHPGHTRSDWVWAVQNRDTISGYWVWVAYQLTQDDD